MTRQLEKTRRANSVTRQQFRSASIAPLPCVKSAQRLETGGPFAMIVSSEDCEFDAGGES